MEKESKSKASPIKEIRQAFLIEIEKIKGFYSDGIQAFYYFNQQLNLSRTQVIEMLKKVPRNLLMMNTLINESTHTQKKHLLFLKKMRLVIMNTY